MELTMNRYSPVLFIGLAPSTRNDHPSRPFEGTKSGERLASWREAVGINSYGLCNLFKHVLREPPSKDSLKKAGLALESYARGFKYVVALGNDVSLALRLAGIAHYKLPHPSGRNRLFNNKLYEPQMLARFREWLDRQAV